MGIRTCNDCGNRISTDAFRCPICGKSYLTFFDVMAGLFILLCVVIAGAFLYQGINDPNQFLHMINRAEGLVHGRLF